MRSSYETCSFLFFSKEPVSGLVGKFPFSLMKRPSGATEMHLQVQTTAPQVELQSAIVGDRTPLAGMFIVDATLRIISADTVGLKALQRDSGVRLQFGKLCTGSMSLNARIRDGITSGVAANGIHFETREGDDLVLSVMPVAALDGAASGQAVVMIRAEKPAIDRVAAVQKACGLTTAETEVLRLIFKGLSTVEVAGVLGLAKTTVRTHLQHIFTKTETSRQSELVHFVAAWQA
jgi:DNA-binding CsgD family transcriptional regulator